MTIRPSLEEFLSFGQQGAYSCVPVSTEMLSDIATPIGVLKKLKNVSDHCYLLESVENRDRWGRYTFLGFDPILQIDCRAGVLHITESYPEAGQYAAAGQEGAEVKEPAAGMAESASDGRQVHEIKTSDPGRYIREVLSRWHAPKLDYLPSFAGGLVGYFSYDYLQYAEPSLRLDAEDTEHFNDVDLMLFDKVIAFDNFRQKIILIANARLEGGAAAYEKAAEDLRALKGLIVSGQEKEEQPGTLQSEVTALFDKEAFCAMIEKAKYHIHEGDIFQIVLSNRLEAAYEGSLLNCYRILRTINPSPYMFYFSGTDVEVAGASPETLVKLEDGVLHTFPLAGTRPRGKTEEEDRALEAELLADPKELAEHNMLVDLGRNDIGKISRFGSVKVEKYHEIERYSHVMHIGSTVRGEIREGLDALDAVDSILPAGTLSGAPKIRACQLINDLENNKRGIYGGAIGYIDFTGNLDTCIAIRIAYRKNGKVFVRSGAGIVADSVPEKEYQECINKAAAVVTALKEAGELG